MHGYEVRDPYEKLEYDGSYEENPLARDWVERQNKATEAFLSRSPIRRGPIDRRLDELSKVGYVSRPAVARDRTFFTRRVGNAEQPVLVLREKDGKERDLLDVSSLDGAGKVALDWYYPSPSGKKVAYGLSQNGSEQSVLHVLDVDTGKELGDAIPDTRAASVAWLKDETGFYYSRYPPGTNFDRRIFFHQLGDDPAKDRKVFGDGLASTDWVDVSISHDDRAVFITTSKGWSKTEVDLLDRRSGNITKLTGGLDAIFAVGEMVSGKVYLLTNHGAPRFRLVAVDPARPAPAAWKTVIPEGAWPMENALFTGGRILITRTVKAVSHLQQYALDGKPEGEVKLPDLGAIDGISADYDGDRAVFGYATFLTPPALHEITVGKAAGASQVLAQVPNAPDTSAFTVEQVDYPSYDGTLVPMFLLHRKDATRNAKNLVLLTGYGGFNVSYTPAFSTNALFWLERGGVFALANLRGGAEFGETWHQAGKLGNKHQVFRDFEHAMRWLIQSDWTRPERLAITGGSNGGLLMGAMMTQAPELFRVCVGRVGLYDMLKFQKWKLGNLWVDEYGSSANPEQIGYLLGYSPYHQVLDGVAYPAFLGLTGDSDSRVTGVHTLKFVARLQDAQAGKAPILFHMERKAGHGQGKNRSDAVAEQAMLLQFMLSQLPPPAPGNEKTAAAQ